MRIIIDVIPHNTQRYETAGDWFWVGDGEELHVFVSDLKSWKLNFLIAFHEMIEAVLCKDHDVSSYDVDQFDLKFEALRKEGNKDEPGDDMTAPYYFEHQTASGFERMMAASLGVNWPEYERRIEEL